MARGRYMTEGMYLLEDRVDSDARPRRARRKESKDNRNKDRMKSLQIGFVQGKRAERWAVRSHRDWLMYAVYEHLFDLARFRGRYRGIALVFLWEITVDLHVNAATVSRKIRKLEELNFIRFSRSKSDCFPNVLQILGYESKPDSTDDISHGGQNMVTTSSEREGERFTPATGQRSESV